MNVPKIWTDREWARAATTTLPGIDNDGRHMTCAATKHHADYVGDGRWVVSYLPGRQFDTTAAKTAMLIASAPEWDEVERWAPKLGLTASEARLFVKEPSA